MTTINADLYFYAQVARHDDQEIYTLEDGAEQGGQQCGECGHFQYKVMQRRGTWYLQCDPDQTDEDMGPDFGGGCGELYEILWDNR